MKLVDINKLDNTKEFWSGSEIRIYNVGMNVPTEEDFYDYMLISPRWEDGWMYLVNVTHGNNKAGSLLSALKIDSPVGNHAVTCKELKRSVGTKDVFVKIYK